MIKFQKAKKYRSCNACFGNEDVMEIMFCDSRLQIVLCKKCRQTLVTMFTGKLPDEEAEEEE